MFRSSRSKMVKCKRFIFEKQFQGFPKKTDLKLVEEELPPLKNGEFLAKAVFLSVDPYMRAYAPSLATGDTFLGSQVAKIIESKNPKYPVGKHVCAQFGWRSHTIAQDRPYGSFPIWVLPEVDLPVSLFLGVLGMPGNTAYFGFLEICQPKSGETVVITGAAGAVGSHVGQIAKIKGCRVVGVAGSDEKGKWLVNELKFDAYVNYKNPDFKKALKEATPKGIDCYFDNVGGEISSYILTLMNNFGRISVCGAISGYNEAEPKANLVQFPMVMKQLKMEGFHVTRWAGRNDGVVQNTKWVKEGKLKYKETVTEGFDNMFEAFVQMLKGANTGKAVVKA